MKVEGMICELTVYLSSSSGNVGSNGFIEDH